MNNYDVTTINEVNTENTISVFTHNEDVILIINNKEYKAPSINVAISDFFQSNPGTNIRVADIIQASHDDKASVIADQAQIYYIAIDNNGVASVFNDKLENITTFTSTLPSEPIPNPGYKMLLKGSIEDQHIWWEEVQDESYMPPVDEVAKLKDLVTAMGVQMTEIELTIIEQGGTK